MTTTTTPKNEKAGHPTKSKPANDHEGKCTGCACAKQQIPMTRFEIFAGLALVGILASAKDSKDVFRLCVEHDLNTVQMAFMLASKMDSRATMEGAR